MAGSRDEPRMTDLKCGSAIAQFQVLPYITRMTQAFSISESAAARVAHLLKTEPAGTRLRVAVDGGGCSGFQYKYDFEQAGPAPDDKLFGTTDAPVIVDDISLGFISGAMLDYVETLGAASFEIKNPNAKSSCGCGNSFSVGI